MKTKLLCPVLAALLLFCGCGRRGGGGDVDISEIPEVGGTISLQMRTPDTLDVLLTQRQTTRDALLIAYEPLFNVTDKFGIEPVLAEGYAFSADASSLRVKLKSGVSWHNGERFSADDVLYTVNKILENPSSSYYQNLEELESVEKSGDEIVFRLKKPYSQFIYSLYFPIENEGVDASQTLVGTGAYMLEEINSRKMTLRRFDGWHGGGGYSDKIDILFMRTREMAQEAFSSGKIHAVSADMLDDENFAIKEGMKETCCPNGVFEFIGFNTSEGIFSDPLLRIAAANAVDRTAAERAYGSGVASGFPVMTGSEAFSPSYETTSFDAEYAGEVIFSAGWTDTDYDNKPEKTENGVRRQLSFTLLVSDSDEKRVSAAREAVKTLDGAGFTVSLEIADKEEYERRVSEGEFDAFFGAVYVHIPYDVSALCASYGKENYFMYKSSDMDGALASLAKAGDEQSFSSAFSAVQSVFVAEQPFTGIVFRNSAIVTQPQLKGDFAPYPYSPYANIHKWFLTSK